MAALQWTVQPGPVVPANPAPLTTRSLGCVSGLPTGCPSVPGGAASSQLSFLPHPGQAVSLQDSGSPSPGPSRVTHSVTFTITNEAFSAALGNPASLEYQLLSENIRHQLQSVCHEAFSSFEGVGVLLFRPDSAAVNASLVFGGLAPGPSAREVLWTLYRKVKAAGKLLGSLYWMRAVSPLRPQPWLCRVRPDRPGPGDHQHPSHGHEALPAPAPPAWLCPLCPAGKDDPPTGHTRAVRILYSTSPGRAPAPLQVGWALPLLPSLPCSSPGGHPGAEGGVTPSQAMGAMGWGPPGEGFVQIAPAGPIKLCPGR
ncbi:taste receptor cell protein 1-like isoform X5 [Tursiops truncatus]|uniref:taste receptor cell protein 1-like isoform X5 n=1 Tax=Tursiops truncatus TaxID=9739 RepID=UPI003CCFB2F4